MNGLCDSCQKSYDGWLGYKIKPILKIASGATYDDTARGVSDNRHARYEEWRTTVNSQCDLIRRICRTKHQDIEP